MNVLPGMVVSQLLDLILTFMLGFTANFADMATAGAAAGVAGAGDSGLGGHVVIGCVKTRHDIWSLLTGIACKQGTKVRRRRLQTLFKY